RRLGREPRLVATGRFGHPAGQVRAVRRPHHEAVLHEDLLGRPPLLEVRHSRIAQRQGDRCQLPHRLVQPLAVRPDLLGAVHLRPPAPATIDAHVATSFLAQRSLLSICKRGTSGNPTTGVRACGRRTPSCGRDTGDRTVLDRHTLPMLEVPETRYAESADGVQVAYQVWGEGPLDLVARSRRVPSRPHALGTSDDPALLEPPRPL